MHKIYTKVPERSEYPKLVQKLLDSVSKGFDIDRSRDLEKAIELATYLQVLGNGSDFNEFLESFIYDIRYSDKSYAWAHKCDGLSLLAYDSELKGDQEKELKAVDIVASKNFDKNDVSWLVDNASDELEYNELDNESYNRIKDSLTLREKTQGHYSKIVKFCYYYQLVKFFSSASNDDLITEIRRVIEDERRRLRALLV